MDLANYIKIDIGTSSDIDCVRGGAGNDRIYGGRIGAGYIGILAKGRIHIPVGQHGTGDRIGCHTSGARWEHAIVRRNRIGCGRRRANIIRIHYVGAAQHIIDAQVLQRRVTGVFDIDSPDDIVIVVAKDLIAARSLSLATVVVPALLVERDSRFANIHGTGVLVRGTTVVLPEIGGRVISITGEIIVPAITPAVVTKTGVIVTAVRHAVIDCGGCLGIRAKQGFRSIGWTAVYRDTQGDSLARSQIWHITDRDRAGATGVSAGR